MQYKFLRLVSWFKKDLNLIQKAPLFHTHRQHILLSMITRLNFIVAVLATFLSLPSLLLSDNATFDLDGPALHLRVMRGKQTLGIGEVPNLLSGDKLWIQPAFPKDQTVRYLLIVSFLRGATNPPPKEWFTKAETWSDDVRSQGITVTVPQGAKQALLMLAPATGGDFTTLRGTVSGKPGAFVRAAQDLEQASMQRSRLDGYIEAVKRIAASDPNNLRKKAPLLAKSLKIKLDEECFDKPADQQAMCLTQDFSDLVLNDGSTQSMVAALTSEANSDLIGQISSSQLAGGGAYSPYVGAVVDMVKIFGSIHTAKYQYIPALSLFDGEQMRLKLNNPPSFRDPKSVIVAGLPPIGPSHPPALLSHDAVSIRCLQDSSFVLPVDDAPLLFSTGYGRSFRLQMKDSAGKPFELTVVGDAARGGFIIKDAMSLPLGLNGQAKLKGLWGFDNFEGPVFHILSAGTPGNWKLRPADKGKLMAGQENTVHLLSPRAGCSEMISLAANPAKALTWKSEKPGEIELQLSLENVEPGEVELKIKQFGIDQAETVNLRAYSNDIKFDGFSYHSGDASLSITGTHLEQISSLKLAGVQFVPSGEALSGSVLTLTAQGDVSVLKPRAAQTAKILLRDERTLDLKGEIEAIRPRVTLLNKHVLRAPEGNSLAFLRLGDAGELPINDTLTFIVKSDTKFERSMKLEVAAIDESISMQLGFSDGGLMLQDATSVRAEINPVKSFGPSVFGELRFRAVDEKGGKGDWQPLVRLVRLPKITRIVCPEDANKPCRLEGSDLFLISSFSSDEKFTTSAVVSEGFAEKSISVPRPNGTLLYLKLRDSPEVVNRLLAPVFPER
jgi:hypothetical protein